MEIANGESTSRPQGRKRIRTISTLTEEQLRKKRGIDREAQRAVRERTKLRIQNLEEELSNVTSEHAEQITVLNSTIQHLRDENQSLKHRLNNIRNLTVLERDNGLQDAEPIIAADTSPKEATIQEVNSSAALEEEPESSEATGHGDTNGTAVEAVNIQDNQLEGDESARFSTSHTTVYNAVSGVVSGLNNSDSHQSFTVQNPSAKSPIAAAESIVMHTSSDRHRSIEQAPVDWSHAILAGPSLVAARPTSYDRGSSIPASTAWDSDPRYVPDMSRDTQAWPRPEGTSTTDEYLDSNMAGSRSIIAGSLSSHESATSPEVISPGWVQPETNNLYRYSILPKHLAATCPLDQILLDFLASRRSLAAQGTPKNALIGPLKPAVSGLLEPRFRTNVHACSRVIVDVVSTFTDTDLTEQLGFLCIMYATMRWQIACDHDSYENLPSWLQPTVLQVVVPHSAWIDNIPWPRLRDTLIQNPHKYTFRDFSEMYARCARLNWPYKSIDALIRNDATGEFSLNPLFEKHAFNLDCWTVAAPFKDRFPELAAELRA